MPGGYIIDPARNLVFTRGWGATTDKAFLAHSRALASDPMFRPTMHQISDLRGIAHPAMTSAGMQASAMLNPFGAGSRRAIVVGNDVLFGMARMYDMMRSHAAGDHYGVFKSMEDACAWLGLADELATIEEILARVPEMFSDV